MSEVTFELNEVARRELDAIGAIGLSKNYPTYKPGEGFPAETCISVNDEVVHGIPGNRTLKEGDVVTLDVALQVNGYFADTATTVPVGRTSPENQKLLDVTKETLFMAIRNIKPGKRWSEIVEGLPADAVVNAVRADPVRRGLLYAGTERSVYVSFDDGDHWQPLRLNMPASSIRDLMVKDDDLVAATHGRGFWILDNITPLRQLNPAVAGAAFLFKPLPLLHQP